MESIVVKLDNLSGLVKRLTVALLLPTPERKARLQRIHQALSRHKLDSDDSGLQSAVLLMLADPQFKKHLSLSKLPVVQTPADCLNVAWQYFYMLLYARDYVAAAYMIWGPRTFSPEPHCTQLMWKALFDHSLINVMGSASVGKTFSPAAWCLLDWVLDPEWTRVALASNSEDHVKKNLFGDFVRLHQESVLELPGKVDTESISLDKKRAMGIFILTIPGGPVTRGKLKGAKIKNRPNHPLFGENSRLRILLDEAQEIPPIIFDEIPNLLSSMDNTEEHIKILAGANPKDQWSRYGQNCKPVGGWEKITALQETWESETGWWVISINAMQTENVVQRKSVFPRMITWEGVQKIIRSQGNGNEHHPIVYTYVYGRFPPMGLSTTIIKQTHLTASEGDWIFDTVADNFGGHDPAFTGDDPALAFGRGGRAIGWLDFNGVRHDLPEPKMAIQIDMDTILNRGDTQDLVNEGLDKLKHLGVKPEHYGIDRTGVGQGVYDISRRQWKEKVGGTDELAPVIGIHFAESPSETKIADEDTETPLQMFDRVASELWFAAAKLFECDCIRIGRGVSSRALQELAGRCGGMKTGLGKKRSVEGKDVFKSRTGGKSPDCSDAILIMLHVARLSMPGLIPKAKDTELVVSGVRARPWSGFDLAFAGATMRGFEAEETADMMKD